jgi:hypothetical protein
MVPMLRRLFTVLSALSLLLCVATAALWVSSHRIDWSIPFTWKGEGWRVLSSRGRLTIDDQRQLYRERWEQDLGALRAERSRLWEGRAAKRAEQAQLQEQRTRTLIGPRSDPLRDRTRLKAERGRLEREIRRSSDEEDALTQEAIRLVDKYKALMQSATSTPLGSRRSIHYRYPVAATGTLPLIWAGAVSAHHRWRARRQGRGRCASCGYDLRATPGRCPECGAVPAGKEPCSAPPPRPPPSPAAPRESGPEGRDQRSEVRGGGWALTSDL